MSTLGKGNMAGVVARVLADPARSAFAQRGLAGASLMRTRERFEGQREGDTLMRSRGPMDLSDVASPTLLVGGTAHKHRAQVELAARTI